MNYSPKLKKAMEEIKGILHKHDIAGLVVLHTPGNAEYLLELSPSYSRVKIDPLKGTMRIRARLKEDFNGDKKAWTQAMTDTCNMLNLISDVGGQIILSTLQLSEMADKATGAEYFGDGHSSQTTQDN